jgi:heme A synthase
LSFGFTWISSDERFEKIGKEKWGRRKEKGKQLLCRKPPFPRLKERKGTQLGADLIRRWAPSNMRIVLCLHLAFVVVAYSLVALGYLVLSRTTYVETQKAAVRSAVVALAALAVLAGLQLMATRSGKQESLWFALSTIAAFVLLILALSRTRRGTGEAEPLHPRPLSNPRPIFQRLIRQ